MASVKTNHFQEPPQKTLFEKEEEILSFWKKNRVFEKSLKKNSPRQIFSFYDGPPFITGLPHYATLLPSIAKDIVPRYQTMKGRYVPRVWGWDVHGLPAENKVEQQLGLRVKKDIEKLGVDKFIEAARKYVAEGSAQWRWYIDHIGRWADMDKPYRTDDLSYMESVIWVFKRLYDKKLIYKGQRVSLYCPRCATPLSKFEVTMDTEENYRDVEDLAVTIAFKLKGVKETYALAWTTTPWTLPANNGLAVNPRVKYITITNGKKNYVLAEKALERYPEFKQWKKVKSQAGQALAGQHFEPLFQPTFKPDFRNDFCIHAAGFPTTEEGTGIVHIAPAFGEDDFNLGQDKKLTAPVVLDEDGKFLTNTPYPWAGVYFKKADPLVLENLRRRGSLVREEKMVHAYPHCYRCSTPLIYMAQDSWFMRIDPIRRGMVETNKKINWVPEHYGRKRFRYNLENAPDWSLSRTRYWGTPMPVWETKDGERIVVGSIKEIEKLSGKKIKDLHRPGIDEIVLTAPSGKKAYRVKEILDVWFESGAMPYAQDHYPFENKERFRKGFPADFIVEYTAQLRGWFYCLHVLANALWKSPAFTNVIVTGTMMGTDGKKMSKSKGNYPDPRSALEKYGADAFRLYLMSSKIMDGEDMSLNERDLQEARNTINILHNAHRYFITYANLHGWSPGTKTSSKNILDRWLEIRLRQFIKDYSQALDKFDLSASTKAIRPFIEDLSTWYIRRNRTRFVDGDKQALATLYGTLLEFSKAIAPTLPFTAEYIYQNLKGRGGPNRGPMSVHLCDYPKIKSALANTDKQLLKDMALVRAIASVVHNLRSEANQPLRQKMTAVILKNASGIKTKLDLVNLLREEANVAQIKFGASARSKDFLSAQLGNTTVALDTHLTEELKLEGLFRELLRQLQDVRKQQGLKVGQKVILQYRTRDKEIARLIQSKEDEIRKGSHFIRLETLASEQGISLLNGKLLVGIRIK